MSELSRRVLAAEERGVAARELAPPKKDQHIARIRRLSRAWAKNKPKIYLAAVFDDDGSELSEDSAMGQELSEYWGKFFFFLGPSVISRAPP
eukprot:173562-Pyramimonas_sp.AAC.1